MKTIQIDLPDDLVLKAESAGLLTAEAMEAMLREWLRRRAGETLRAMWEAAPRDELAQEVEQEIADIVHKVRVGEIRT
jgi:hypothetical protein